MALFELVMPKLGESIEEATITKWFIKEGDVIDDDDVLLEIATDKVDSEIPSPVAGKVKKILFKQDDTVAVETIIAIIDTDAEGGDSDNSGDETEQASPPEAEAGPSGTDSIESSDKAHPDPSVKTSTEEAPEQLITSTSGRFYSPLVRKIAAEENISQGELESIAGTGINSRVRKQDLLEYIKTRKPGVKETQVPGKVPSVVEEAPKMIPSADKPRVAVSVSAGDEIIEMDRMRKLIADHMVMSKQVSPHVTNMLEADVTDIVLWRNRIKDEYLAREKEKITYLPVFLEAIIKALKDFPMINGSVDGYNIIIRKHINLGIAVALPTGNLIVPVIRDADQYNLLGLTKALNQMAEKARNNKLSPDDIQGGTFTISNFGTFRNVMGTPIINQPQAAILAIGTVEKKPAVIETPTGDIIGIRHKMFISLTYDHRIIDGAYGGAFLRKLADYMESFDGNRSI